MKLTNYLIYLFWFVLAPFTLAQEGSESESESEGETTEELANSESQSAQNPTVSEKAARIRYFAGFNFNHTTRQKF